MKPSVLLLPFFLLWFVLASGIGDTSACMSFRVTAKDQNIMIGRTMELGADGRWKIAVVPRKVSFRSPAPGGKDGLTWESKYGYVGVVGCGIDTMVNDGLNEKGLSFAWLWFENDMQWQDIRSGEEQRALAQTMIGSWMLGNCATVDEVKKAIAEVKIFGYAVPELGTVPPAHWIVYDADGKCIVVEIEDGKVQIYDNPLGNLTNAPRFPWHLAYLRQFIGMNSENPKPREMAGMKIIPTGHGAGMIGVPGDLTPPSRFIRLGLTTILAEQPENAEKNLNVCQHIVSSFTITRGMVTEKISDGRVFKETTQFASFRDLTNRIFYFLTYENPDVRKVDLKKLDFSGDKVKFIRMDEGTQSIKDVTGTAK